MLTIGTNVPFNGLSEDRRNQSVWTEILEILM